jgi:outer membrane protein OmpA-like peptidoglycan-associated protein
MNRIISCSLLFNNRLMLFVCIVFVFFQPKSFPQEKLEISIVRKSGNLYMKNIPYKPGDNGTIKIDPLDSNGRSIPDLKAEDIIIKNKRKNADIQSVISLGGHRDKKVRILLFVDNSTSMSPFKNDIIPILDSLVERISEKALISVIDFDPKFYNKKYPYEGEELPVRILESKRDRYAIRQFYINSFKDLTLNTYLYDELFVGLESIRKDSINADKNIGIIISDGQDTRSTVSGKYFRKYDFTNIIFYAIYFTHSLGESAKMNTFLWSLAKKTGGAYFNPNNISDLIEYIKLVANDIVGINLGYIVNYSFPKLKPKLNYEFPLKEKINEPDYIKNFDGLVVRDIKIRESFPLLNYIFFRPGDDIIPLRYKQFKGSGETKSFSEALIEGGALDHYYHILNIIGERMRKNIDAKIIIAGCNIGNEIEGKKLSARRAGQVKNYFEKIWRISPQRMSIQIRDLPEKPSNNHTIEGQSENCRVEIQCNDWQILKPVTFQQNSRRIIPSGVSFSISPNTPAGEKGKALIEKWSVNIKRNNDIWKSFNSKNSKDKFSFDWRNLKGEIPADEAGYEVSAEVIDNSEETIRLEKVVIPVKQIKIEKNLVDSSLGESINKISLVLFDFGKYELGTKNDSIMNEFVYPKLKNKNLYITINGYTDKIGPEDANLKLSESRAKSVMEKIKRRLPSENIYINGYGPNKPIFDNNLPEGRFYNRTVQLLIQTFKPEDGKAN